MRLTLELLLSMFSVRRPYKSPFERKRESEIKKLDRKLSQGHAIIREQQQGIEALERDIRLQKLTLLKDEIG